MSLITLKNCDIVDDAGHTLLENITWSMGKNEAHLITGDNSSGKKYLLDALAGTLTIKTNKNAAQYSNIFTKKVNVVSLEAAAALIHTERENDESDYLPGGVDIGRTVKKYISEVLPNTKNNTQSKDDACDVDKSLKLEVLPEVKLCGVEHLMDRGLKYLSTGEIRRVMLCRCLLSGAKLIILSDVYSGLDTKSRDIIGGFIDNIIARQITKNSDSSFPYIIFCSGRYIEIPKNITNVLEFNNGKVNFCGKKSEYEKQLTLRKNALDASEIQKIRSEFAQSVKNLAREVRIALGYDYNFVSDTLIEMNNVNVAWGDNHVLRNLNWKVSQGEHYLICGPNGSGKTTLLELITGDNGQVFSNDVKLFGRRRGPDLTIWDLKHLLGIVSYRIHVEYRMLGGTCGRDVVVSGFHDSIGLYDRASDTELSAANNWLKITGLQRLSDVPFGAMSYGEQRAILIVRAAAKCPPLLVLDEPCHALDEQNRAMVLSLLENIALLGTSTLLHVTHEADEVLGCCHHKLELLPDGDPMWKNELI